MELTEFRNSAVQRWLRGDPEELVKLVLSGSLNTMERDLVAQIVSGNPPKRSRGRKRISDKPIRAALIRYWLRDHPPHHNKDTVQFEIARILGVSERMARKLLRQIDKPKTVGEAEAKYLADWRIRDREMCVLSLGFMNLQDVRADDLEPISDE